MSKPTKQHARALAGAVTEVLHADPSVEREAIDTALREMFVSQRSVLNTLLRDSIITDETYAQLVSEVNTALSDPDSSQIKNILSRPKDPIRGLMTIVIQDSDVENVVAILNRLGTSITRLSSSGGFLGRKNATLLVGVPEGKELVILNAISNASRERVEYIPGSVDASDPATPVTVGSATIFSFDVERYEEL